MYSVQVMLKDWTDLISMAASFLSRFKVGNDQNDNEKAAKIPRCLKY